MIKVICKECNNEFEKQKNHYNYAEKMKRLHFCSISCWSKFTQKNLPPDKRKVRNERLKDFKGYDRTDEFSPFRYYIKTARMGCKNKKLCDIMNLDLQYLKLQWENQKGICPYTGIKMRLGENINAFRRIRSLTKASLDRIDSTKGYIKGNVEFVCCGINYSKNSFTKEDMKEFIKEIKNAGISSGI